MVGVTGTNGKTSCSQWIAQALSAPRRASTAVIGTLGSGFPGRARGRSAEHHAGCDRPAARAGRASRDAGAQGVRDGGLLDRPRPGSRQRRRSSTCALFTNLSRDHLDYHGDMEALRAGQDAAVPRAGPRPRGAQSRRRARRAHRAHARAAPVRRVGYSLSRGAAAARGLEHCARGARSHRVRRRHCVPPRVELGRGSDQEPAARALQRRQPARRARRAARRRGRARRDRRALCARLEPVARAHAAARRRRRAARRRRLRAHARRARQVLARACATSRARRAAGCSACSAAAATATAASVR